jgi:hypothetical protein
MLRDADDGNRFSSSGFVIANHPVVCASYSPISSSSSSLEILEMEKASGNCGHVDSGNGGARG